MNKNCIHLFPKKVNLGITKNYRGITLTSIAAKVYNTLLVNYIKFEIEKILRKNQNGFRRNRSTTSQILTIRRIIEGVRAKNLVATLLFVDFFRAFDKKETAIMMLYRNTKAKVPSPDGDRLFRYCCCSFARRYINTIFVYNLPRQRTSNVDRSNKKITLC